MKRLLWINIVLGLWLFVGPFAMGYSASSGVALMNDLVVGVLLISGAWWVLIGNPGAFGIVLFEAVCGIWLVIAPFALQISNLAIATFNGVIVGLIVLFVSLAVARELAKPAVPSE